MRLRRMRHEPLRAAGVFARKRHADCGAFIRYFIDLAADLIAGSAVLIAARIAGLDDKIWHDARNRLAIKIASLRKLNKVINIKRGIRR